MITATAPKESLYLSFSPAISLFKHCLSDCGPLVDLFSAQHQLVTAPSEVSTPSCKLHKRVSWSWVSCILLMKITDIQRDNLCMGIVNMNLVMFFCHRTGWRSVAFGSLLLASLQIRLFLTFNRACCYYKKGIYECLCLINYLHVTLELSFRDAPPIVNTHKKRRS